MLTRSNAKAYAVLAVICAEMTDDQWRNSYVEPYLNGRENGFAIQFVNAGNNRKKLVFSEVRNSDQITVYEGSTHDFSMQGNGLTEKIYANAKEFGEDQYTEAVIHIIERLQA